ncbi:MAG: hypothetical protein GWN73_37335, partial [Actinobacteria bacterium]|nr:hypothetical protein [Actinomycetota bacterium]NIS36158.1 hypothetical protein [Actinomycetota bacterium]NIT98561.1 hypothetical protein [Actinomycetota bacterium]NIU70730.1 hypothetical protein [Actinomycetota bacterium]NIW32635.1 hypothetical protein [Actinomycetota bacterium]
TRPVFLQVAADDEAITREMSDRLSGAASEPKQTVTYDTTHSFDDTGAAADRIDWLLN